MFSHYVLQSMAKNPMWKSQGRIIGEAGEAFAIELFPCQRCQAKQWIKAKVNEPGHDMSCAVCHQKVQIKTFKKSTKQQLTIAVNRKFKIASAKYELCLQAKQSNVDYLFIPYTKEFHVEMFLYQKHEVAKVEDVIKRNKPLKGRPGYYLSDLSVHSFEIVPANPAV